MNCSLMSSSDNCFLSAIPYVKKCLFAFTQVPITHDYPNLNAKITFLADLPLQRSSKTLEFWDFPPEHQYKTVSLWFNKKVSRLWQKKQDMFTSSQITVLKKTCATPENGQIGIRKESCCGRAPCSFITPGLHGDQTRNGYLKWAQCQHLAYARDCARTLCRGGFLAPVTRNELFNYVNKS